MSCELLSEWYFVLGFTGAKTRSGSKWSCELLSEWYFVLGFTGKVPVTTPFFAL